MELSIIRKSHNHDHFWTENNIVYESYKTLRGMRYMEIVILEFNYPDKDNLTESDVSFLNNILNSKN